MQFKRPLPLFFLIILVIGIILIPPSVHATIPIYDRTVETDCSVSPCTSASVATSAGDTIMVDLGCYSSAQNPGVISDSLGTVFTIVNQLTIQQTGSSSQTVYSGTSSGGADTVTINCPLSFTPQSAFSVDIYSFVTGIGVTNKNFGTVASGTSSDTLTMTIQPNSFIYEGMTVSDANSVCPTNSAGSGQNVRATFGCGALGGNRINGLTMDKQVTNGGSTGSTASWTVVAGSTTFTHVTVELLASGGSVTQVSNCYGNCGSPAVTRVNTNSTKGINFNISQTFFYENQILFPALIINESASVACTYGTAQCPNGNTLLLGLWVTQTNCFGSVPFTSSCPGLQVFSQSVTNPTKGLFTISPNYNVFTGQWIALGFSASSSGMQLNDTNTLVNIFNTPGFPSTMNNPIAQGQSKANVYAWATGNTVKGGGITPAPTVCINTDLACFMIASACALTPSNCFIGGAVYLFIYFTIFVIGISICITWINNSYDVQFHFPPMIFFLFFLVELFMFTAMGLIPQYITIVIFIFTALSVAGYFGSQFRGAGSKD